MVIVKQTKIKCCKCEYIYIKSSNINKKSVESYNMELINQTVFYKYSINLLTSYN